MQTTTHNTKKFRSRILIGACIALLAFALAACGSSSKSDSSGSSAGAAITIKNLSFGSPASVQTGSTVTVKNDDDVTHTVTSNDGTSFNVTVEPGETATFTAPKTEGQYPFHCNIHASMKATLNVQ